MIIYIYPKIAIWVSYGFSPNTYVISRDMYFFRVLKLCPIARSENPKKIHTVFVHTRSICIFSYVKRVLTNKYIKYVLREQFLNRSMVFNLL